MIANKRGTQLRIAGLVDAAWGDQLKAIDGSAVHYDESGVCGMNLDGTDYYYRKNMLGDICAVYSGAGELLCRYVYDAWGNHRLYDKDGNQIADDGTSIGSKNPFRYRGYYWDREFGLYYLQSRYYDPVLGRFILIGFPMFILSIIIIGAKKDEEE